MKKPADLLTPGRWLCCAIGLMWLAGMLCHYFGAEAAVPWLLWAGVILSAALLGMLIVQLLLVRKQEHTEHSSKQ